MSEIRILFRNIYADLIVQILSYLLLYFEPVQHISAQRIFTKVSDQEKDTIVARNIVLIVYRVN